MSLKDNNKWKIIDKDIYIDDEIFVSIERGEEDIVAGCVYIVQEFWEAMKEDYGWDFGI